MVGNNFIGRQMSAIKPYFEKKKLKFTYDDMLKNSVPELRNFKKNLLIPE